VQDAERVFTSRIGIRFLCGLGKLQKDFHIAFAATEHTHQEGNYLFKLVPREPDFGIGELLVAIDRETFYVRWLSFADTYGNATRLHFRNIKINNKLPDKMFSFSPPPGVDIYR
jgi:outer membrane lipoprotein carrier protein